MKDEILLDQETAWKLFGAFNVEGRTVRVQDMYLRIAGVYKKETGSLYQKAGLADYVVFVQYKTLLQYGGSEIGTDQTDRSDTKTAPKLPAASEEDSDPDSDTDTGSDSGSGAGSDSGSGSGSGSASESDSGSGSQSGDSSKPGSGEEQGSFTEDTQNMENVGTTNTNYKDTGMITSYEIVMPDPVEGYAAAALKKALGDESGAIVVDNTNRFGTRNLIEDIRNFAFLGMRTRNVRYPYWENVAMGWETIFAALFLLECILIVLTILLIVWMILHWFRHKSWTLAGSIQNMQEGVYERQSRKRYPEYYKEKEQSEDVSFTETEEKKPAASAKTEQAASVKPENSKEKGRLEDKGLTPFEWIPENRKAVEYETKYQNDQRGDGSGAGSDNDGMRRRKQ